MADLFEHIYPIPAGISERLEIAWRRLEFNRNYMLAMVEELTDDDWYWTPDSYPTCIAWQVGHIAMAEYGLALFRQRGRESVDSELMSSPFRKQFMKGSTPHANRESFPERSEIMAVLDRVHRQVRIELPTFDGPALDEQAEPPHTAFATRYGALLFAADHEMIHAGQIGMLRRLMGKEPLR